MSELQDFEIFMVTARKSSFTEAAGELRMSVATVSRAILRLEQTIDCRLFNRTTRRLSLTEEGKLAFSEISAGMYHLRNIRAQLQEKRDTAAGTVRVLLPNGFAKNYLMPALPAFLAQYPRIDLDITVEDFGYDLLAGGFDVAVQHGPVPENGYIMRTLGNMRIILVASPDYLARYGNPACVADLAHHQCMQSRQRKNGPKFIWQLLNQRTGESFSHEPHGRMFMNSQLDASIFAAIAGIGIAPSDILTVLPHLLSGELKVVLPDHELTGGTMFMLYPHRDHVPLSVRSFMQLIADGGPRWLRLESFDAHRFAVHP